MKNKIARLLVIVLAFLAGGLAHAGGLGDFWDDFRKASDEGKAGVQLLFDNDSFLLNREDRFYTSGARLTRQYALRAPGHLTIFGWRIGQDMYTASDIKLPPEQVGPPDHPYAAWLYGGVFKEAYRADGAYLKYGIDIGCLGPCAGGEWVQTNLHHLLNQPLPQGWSKQVRNEWGAVLYGEIASARWKLTDWLDAAPVLHARFGNIQADAGGGALLRAGRLSDLPDQPGWFGFVRVDARAVAYNATLQGGYFSHDNPHTVAPKRLVGEAELGMDWRSGPYGITASIIRRSNEIRDLPNSVGAQNFARLVFSYLP